MLCKERNLMERPFDLTLMVHKSQKNGSQLAVAQVFRESDIVPSFVR